LHETSRPSRDRISSSMALRPKSLTTREEREMSRDPASRGAD
jgi:hypothetical protein